MDGEETAFSTILHDCEDHYTESYHIILDWCAKSRMENIRITAHTPAATFNTNCLNGIMETKLLTFESVKRMAWVDFTCKLNQDPMKGEYNLHKTAWDLTLQRPQIHSANQSWDCSQVAIAQGGHSWSPHFWGCGCRRSNSFPQFSQISKKIKPQKLVSQSAPLWGGWY